VDWHRRFVEALAEYAPDGTSVCVEDRDEAQGFTAIFVVVTDPRGEGEIGRRFCIYDELIADEQWEMVDRLGQTGGEHFALLVGPRTCGHASIEDAWDAGVLVEAVPWSPDNAVTWRAVIVSPMQLAWRREFESNPRVRAHRTSTQS
jgi:hypothetical protein